MQFSDFSPCQAWKAQLITCWSTFTPTSLEGSNFNFTFAENAMLPSEKKQSDSNQESSENRKWGKIDDEIRKYIDDQINARIGAYRTWVLGFSYAIGLVLFVIVGTEILTKRGIIDYVRDEIMDYENNTLLDDRIKSLLKSNISDDPDFDQAIHAKFSEEILNRFSDITSVSYKDQFVLGRHSTGAQEFVRHHSVVFHAKPSQNVEAIIHLQHSGSSDEKYIVAISVQGVDPNICCYAGEEDIQFESVYLNQAIASSYGGALQPEDDLHFLIFDIKNSHQRLDDTIYGTVVIKVIGMEE